MVKKGYLMRTRQCRIGCCGFLVSAVLNVIVDVQVNVVIGLEIADKVLFAALKKEKLMQLSP